MPGGELLARVRGLAGLSQAGLARRAGTSRTAVSAYEHGRKSPALDTVDRLLAAAGYELDVRPRVEFGRPSCKGGGETAERQPLATRDFQQGRLTRSNRAYALDAGSIALVQTRLGKTLGWRLYYSTPTLQWRESRYSKHSKR